MTAGMGAVLFDPVTRLAERWGAWLPLDMTRVLRSLVGGDQLAGQAEILPAIGARVKWHSVFANRSVLHFIDNDAARYGLLTGYSPSEASCFLIGEFWRVETLARCRSWFERVPSPSNPADGPSRMVFKAQRMLGCEFLKVSPPSFCNDVLERMRMAGVNC